MNSWKSHWKEQCLIQQFSSWHFHWITASGNIGQDTYGSFFGFIFGAIFVTMKCRSIGKSNVKILQSSLLVFHSIWVQISVTLNIKMTECSILGELTFTNDSANDSIYRQTLHDRSSLLVFCQICTDAMNRTCLFRSDFMVNSFPSYEKSLKYAVIFYLLKA